jgi:hypothetical protein
MGCLMTPKSLAGEKAGDREAHGLADDEANDDRGEGAWRLGKMSTRWFSRKKGTKLNITVNLGSAFKLSTTILCVMAKMFYLSWRMFCYCYRYCCPWQINISQPGMLASNSIQSRHQNTRLLPQNQRRACSVWSR